MKYYNLLFILFMIALKCGAVEEPTTINNITVENVTNYEDFSTSTTKGILLNKNSSSVANEPENSLINATDDNAVQVKKTEFDLPISRKLLQGTQIIKNNIGSLLKGLTQPNETFSMKIARTDGEEATTANSFINGQVENVTKCEVLSNSTTEGKFPNNKSSSEAPVVANTFINATDANAISPFKKKEFGKLPITTRWPQFKVVRLMTNIVGSLMEGITQLNEFEVNQDPEAEKENISTVKYFAVKNVTSSELFDTITTKGPINLVDKWTQTPNSNSVSFINATNVNTVSPFKKIEFGKLPIPSWLPQNKGFRIVTNIIGNLKKGIAQLNELDLNEDAQVDKDKATTVYYSAVENVTNRDIFNATSLEGILSNINSSNEEPVLGNTFINSTVANAVSPFKKKEFGKLPIPSRLPQHKGIPILTNIIGSLMKGIAQLNELDLNEDAKEDKEKTTTANHSAVDSVTNCDIFNATSTEGKLMCLQEGFVVNTLINATDVNAVNPLKKKELGKLPILQRLPQYKGIRLMTNIVGSLMDGIAQLNEPDSKEGEADNESVNYSTVDIFTNSEVVGFMSTTEAPENSSSKPSGAEITLINDTHVSADDPFKIKEVGKFPMPIRLPQEGTRDVKNVIGSFVKGFIQKTDSNKETG